MELTTKTTALAESVLSASVVDRRSAQSVLGGSRDHARASVRNGSLIHAVRSTLAAMTPIAVGLVFLIAMVLGWLERDEQHLTPESGLGYALGIGGGIAMLMLALYGLRKRLRWLRAFGSVALWFRMHMMLGVVGPALVLFHANFKLGALNSNVALVTMLMVAGSGVIGRYLYGKIHFGLYGRKAEIDGILAEAEALKESLGEELGTGAIVERMTAFSHSVMTNPPRTLLSSLWRGAVLAGRARFIQAQLLNETQALIRREGKARGWSRRERLQRLKRIHKVIRAYFAAVVDAAEFIFYERLFALWHILHLPLFFLMVTAGFVHVWAVHRY